MNTEHKTAIIQCACYSDEHNLYFHWFNDEPDCMYISLHLRELPFFRRLWFAIKYIFGYHCKYGHFEEFIWSPDQVREAQQQLDKFLSKGELR